MANEKRLIGLDVAIERAKASDNIVGSSIWETSEVVEFLGDCPIEDAVEVVHGYWHVDDYDGGEPDGYAAFIEVHCSKCGYELGAESGQYGWSYGDPFPLNYCPNCGAKMDGERKDNA